MSLRACPGDEVFFHIGGVPKVGKVLSAGAHGCTLEHEGGKHKVRWKHIKGHKTRTKQDYKLIEHGEDGMIVENQHGQRRFVGIPAEARIERLELDEQKGKQIKPGIR